MLFVEGILMILFAGPFLKKSFFKMLNLLPRDCVLMDMSMLWWITFGIGGKLKALTLIP